MMYMCNPDKNVECRKTGCLFYLLGECFSTLDEQNAVRDKDGEPVSFPEDQYEDIKEFIIRNMREVHRKLCALPSAQPEIIRCKDCKYSEHWYRDKSRCFLWSETGIDVFEDGYCNYAGRRDDAVNDMMTFPDTWEEFEKSYGFTDNEEVYTNGARLIPSFRVKQWLDHLPPAQPEPRWIPVKMRPMDSEDREYWEDQFGGRLEDEDAVIFDCPMPEDGQEILVSYRKWISMDKCEIDCGCYGLEGNGDWEDVIAWMPLPEPYKEENR